MDNSKLSEEQKRRIEENKRRALAKKQEKLGQPSPQPQRSVPFKKPTPALIAEGSSHSNNASTTSPSLAQTGQSAGPGRGAGSHGSQGTASTSRFRAAPPEWGGTAVPHHHKNQGAWLSKANNNNQTSDQKSGAGFNKWNNNQTSPYPKGGTAGFNKWTSKQAANQKAGIGKAQFYGQVPKPLKGQCVLISRDRFEVNIGFDEGIVTAFKTISSKNYDAASRKWNFNIRDHGALLKAISGLKPAVQVEPLPKAVLQVFGGGGERGVVPQADLSQVDSTLVDSLMPFQREGVNFGVHLKGRVLIADDMGLGKTLQAVCLSCLYRAKWPLLVIAPSSLRFHWAQQFKRWLPSLDPACIQVVVTGRDDPACGLVNIISYDLLSRKVRELTAARFRVIIMDESHFLKNFKTVRTKAALPLLQAAQHVVLLSGTPALSRPSELYSQIVAVCPRMFKFHDFGLRYCEGKEQAWGWDYSGSSNLGELQLLLEERIMIRRLKQDVLSQLPAKRRQMVVLDPVSLASSRALVKASKAMEKKLSHTEKRGALLQYFHETCKVKLSAVKSYVQDMVAAEKKFLIFAHHQDMMDAIEDTVAAEGVQYIRIDGRTASEQRQALCDRFQASATCRVALLSITAANAGLHLAAAAIVVFAELFWNPGILVQAEDRVHRLGQQNSVLVYYLVAQNTADDYVWPLIQSKLQVLGKAGLAGDDFANTDTAHIRDPKQKRLLDMFEESFIEEGGEEDVKDDPSTSPTAAVAQDVLAKALQSTSPKATFRASPSKRRKLCPLKGQQGIGQFFPTDRILTARSPVKRAGGGESAGPSVAATPGAATSALTERQQAAQQDSSSWALAEPHTPPGSAEVDGACGEGDTDLGEEDTDLGDQALADLAADVDWDDDF